MTALTAHYETVRDRCGCDHIARDVGDLSESTIAHRFVACDGIQVDALADTGTLVTTGVGMTGPPHLGTLGQIRTMIMLQEAGIDVQFVLADLEPYQAGAPIERIRALVGRFRRLIRQLGFDESAGILRTQEESRDVMHTGHLIARYHEDAHWPEIEKTPWEQRVDAAYAAADSDHCGPTSAAAEHHSTVLHLADFLHPLRTGYDRVVLGLGIDEHRLTPWTRNMLAATPIEGTVGGLHGRIVSGRGGAPKMGRSLPGSAIHLGMAPERIHELLTAPKTDAETPEASLTFQAMQVASTHDGAMLDRLAAACRAGSERWTAAREAFANEVAALARTW